MFKKDPPASWTSTQRTRDDDAVFIGWQLRREGEPIALYTITVAGHPSDGSTVTDITLNKLNLRVPDVTLPPRPAKKL